MKPGRELDALIAEKVMRHTVSTIDYECEAGIGTKVLGATGFGMKTIPRYSTDIAAAWQVVEKLRPRYSLNLNDWPNDKPGKYEASFDFRNGEGEGYPSYEAEADTAPHAICLAALKAVGVEI